MIWSLLPYNKHSDDGFGAMADTFENNAHILLKHPEESFSGVELPACYLLRHACELYLKSLLIVTHRFLLNEGETYPTIIIKDGKKPQSITRIHDLKILYDELEKVLIDNSENLAKSCKTEWLPMPEELNNAINKINKLDEGSFFFRYPSTIKKDENKIKSKNKNISTEGLINWNTERKGYIKAFLILNENDEVIDSFNYEKEILRQEIEYLKLACKWLSSFHVGLRMELANGY
ncbi:hypothetical protein ACIPUN_02075 [Pectobacterium sp. CHL-2024]|uniref:hypothetical protein n=1 Tax=Pectobacterium sp. CHL-2024 TaxID=3377079 RepID=UPI0037F14294